jgi:hypothetical protein
VATNQYGRLPPDNRTQDSQLPPGSFFAYNCHLFLGYKIKKIFKLSSLFYQKWRLHSPVLAGNDRWLIFFTKFVKSVLSFIKKINCIYYGFILKMGRVDV